MTLLRFLSVAACVCTVVLAHAPDWPQWRGPHRDGISNETGLLQEWPKDGPKLLWQARDIGSGYSTPAVVGDRLYVLANEGDDNEFVEALSVQDGKRLWSTRLGKVGPNQGPQYPGSRGTPTVDGNFLYALGSDGDLACVAAATGEVRWKKNLRSDFDGKPGQWAYSESPLIDGDALICTPGGSQATLVALNKANGDVLWKSPLAEADHAGYASIIELRHGNEKQYVQFLQKGVVGVDAKTGKFLWRYEATAKGSPANIPTPVVRDDFVYSSTGRGGGGLIKLKDDGGVEQVYYSTKLPTAIGGSVLVGDYLYGTSGQGLLCVDFKTGETKWTERGIGAASILAADGRLYLHGENGDAALVEITPEAYHEKGRFTPPDRPTAGNSKAWAYPVVADGRLYLRELGSLWCYEIKASDK